MWVGWALGVEGGAQVPVAFLWGAHMTARLNVFLGL